MANQLAKVQKDAIARYKKIADLWVAYYVHCDDPSEFGREFYLAVGDLLEGMPLDKLLLNHVTLEQIKNVVFTGRSSESLSRKSRSLVGNGKREKGRKQQQTTKRKKR